MVVTSRLMRSVKALRSADWRFRFATCWTSWGKYDIRPRARMAGASPEKREAVGTVGQIVVSSFSTVSDFQEAVALEYWSV